MSNCSALRTYACVVGMLWLSAMAMPDQVRAVPIPATLFAEGLQNYAATLSNGLLVWQTASTPVADLYTDVTKTTHVGTHFAGPTWQADAPDHSAVVGVRLLGRPSPFPDSIPELLLQATPNSAPGIFHDVTFIERLNTHGGTLAGGVIQGTNTACGVAPTALSQVCSAAYTANYLFVNTPTAPTDFVPEPGTWLLLGTGVVGLLGLQWHRRRVTRR